MNRKKTVDTQLAIDYAFARQIEVASAAALKNCGVLFPSGSKEPPKTTRNAPPTGSAEIESRPERVQRRTRPVMEFAIPDTGPNSAANSDPAPAVPAAVEFPAGNIDESSAFDYFAGQAVGSTYTAELRFRAGFHKLAPASGPPSQPQSARSTRRSGDFMIEDPVSGSYKIFGELKTAPSAFEHSPAIEQAEAAKFNMLDIIDQAYQPIPEMPRVSGSGPIAGRARQDEIRVEYGSNSARLADSPGGLSAGLGSGSAKQERRVLNRWMRS